MPDTASKRSHLQQAVADHPPYEGMLAPLIELFAYIEGKEGETGLSFAFPSEHVAERLGGGLPLLSAEGMTVDVPKATAFLRGAFAVLSKAGGGAAAEADLAAFDKALASDAVDLPALLSATIRREAGPFEAASASLGIPEPLLRSLLEIPMRTALEVASEGVAPSLVAEWTHGYCPVCGGSPSMDELVGDEGKRFLSCGRCFFRWSYPRLQCPFCGTDDAANLGYYQTEGPTRVSMCKGCNTYMKSRDARLGRADVPLEAEDAATIHLDLLAARDGFTRSK